MVEDDINFHKLVDVKVLYKSLSGYDKVAIVQVKAMSRLDAHWKAYQIIADLDYPTFSIAFANNPYTIREHNNE